MENNEKSVKKITVKREPVSNLNYLGTGAAMGVKVKADDDSYLW